VKICNTSFSAFAKEKSLRNDCVYQRIISNGHLSRATDYYRFSDLFSLRENKIEKTKLEDDFDYCQIGDVDKDGISHPVHLNFDERDVLDEDYYKKIEKGDVMSVAENDILFSFLLPQDEKIVGKFIRISNDESDILFSTAFLRINAKKYPEVLYYYLKTAFYKKLVATARIRKGYTGYATLSNDDLLDLRFDKKEINKLFLNALPLTKKIREVEAKVEILRKKILSPNIIIDKVFSNEFDIDMAKIQQIDSKKAFTTSVNIIALKNENLRFSCRWNKARCVQTELSNMVSCCDKLERYIVSANNGWSPECNENDSDYKVLSLDAIEKDGALRLDRVKFTDITRQSMSNYFVTEGDMFVSRGNGSDELIAMASVAGEIPEDSCPIIYPDIMIRVHLLDNVDSKYIAYAINSCFGRMYFKNVAKGSNKKKITPLELGNFIFPCPQKKDQIRIVNIVQSELEKQEMVRQQIYSLRNEIDNMITAIVD